MKIDKQKLMRNFLIKASLCYVLWLGFFHGYVKPTGYINEFLTLKVAQGTTLVAQVFGIDAHVTVEQSLHPISRYVAMIHFDQKPAATVAHGCNGLGLFALFIGFIVCFPGKMIPKICYAVTGTFFLFFVNVLRELALSFNYLYFRSSLEFNHKYTYAIIVYAVVFLIWRHWLNTYSTLAHHS